MTAVAAPVQYQPLQPSRSGWNNSMPVNGGQSAANSMSQEDIGGRMFLPGPRKTAQRTNSSSSISSLSSNSSSSTLSGGTAATNATANSADTWDARKKPLNRGIWPAGKSQPTSGLSTARPQSVSALSTGATAASGLSALHNPLIPQPQMQNGQGQQNGPVRNQMPTEGSAFLYLTPINGTFERKTIHVPYYPDVLRIGRQTNAKTAPTPANGFFDSKVLSRQHAEIYAERNGRIFIRDVKSSNGTFVNGKRLSPENKESEPHELREQDVLELGIDIVSEDQKTVVHHKVAARVEHAGIYSQNGEIGLGDLDPTNTGFMSNQLRNRNNMGQGGPGLKNGGPMNMSQSGMRDPNAFGQQSWSRMWLQPISTEHIVKRLNRELNLARQQSQDIDRAKMTLDSLVTGDVEAEVLDEKNGLANSNVPTSPQKSKLGVNGFSEPPAPPPSHPLPQKPGLGRAFSEAAFQPMLQRADTARPFSSDGTNGDHTNALVVLTHELKAAKDQIPNLQDRVKLLEEQLKEERTARVNAEERAYQLEHGPRKDSAEPTRADSMADSAKKDGEEQSTISTIHEEHSLSDLQIQLDRLQANMSDMKQQMEAYRRRAESAESQRDEARQSLAEMIEEKRARLSEAEKDGFGLKLSRTRSRESGIPSIKSEGLSDFLEDANGHTIRPMAPNRTLAVTALLERAGVENQGKPITRQQAVSLQRILRKELLVSAEDGDVSEGVQVKWDSLSHHGIPHAAALTTVVLGLVVMRWLNGWEKMRSAA